MSLIERIKFFLAGWLASVLVQALVATVRVHMEGKTIEDELHRKGHLIYTFWHGRLLIPTVFRRRLGARILVSKHRDGEYIAQVLRRLGQRPVRGSTRRGGSAALRALFAGTQDSDLAITPDGPRGPRYIAKPGVIFLAQKIGLPILPLGIGMSHFWELRSWDAFRIPKPFSHTFVKAAPPIYLPADISGEEMEALRKELERRLSQATEYADRKALEWTPPGAASC
jgi:lysophospholipid acyltransferase (LPLAT)-like uncharacterized protein